MQWYNSSRIRNEKTLIQHMQRSLKSNEIILWKSRGICFTMDIASLISRTLVTEYKRSDEQTHILRRRVHDNSSFNTFLMTPIIITEAARKRDAEVVS